MADDTSQFESRMAQAAAMVEQDLVAALDDRPRDDEIARPARLLAAMRYAALNGGKRLRPFLVMETTRLLVDRVDEAARATAAALECIHCYSLVHDDLPAMDDDAMRRGMPTVHMAFDEATGILVGDALQTIAFDLIASHEGDLPPERRLELIQGLARASGIGGMASGQALDLQAESSAPDETGIITLQAMKTGALIRFACEAGAMIAGAADDDRQRLRQFGETIGLAFQLADDILDVTADAAMLGKATGKDAGRGKATLVSLHGMEWARTQLDGLVATADEILAPFGERALTLRQTAHFIATRRT
jgi:farnesyl diphosphate synthase